jgi:hypothetical protein
MWAEQSLSEGESRLTILCCKATKGIMTLLKAFTILGPFVDVSGERGLLLNVLAPSQRTIARQLAVRDAVWHIHHQI